MKHFHLSPTKEDLAWQFESEELPCWEEEEGDTESLVSEEEEEVQPVQEEDAVDEQGLILGQSA